MRYVITFVASFGLSACTVSTQTPSDDATTETSSSTGATHTQTTGATSSTRNETSSRPQTTSEPMPSHSSGATSAGTVSPASTSADDVAPTTDASAPDETSATTTDDPTTDISATNDNDTESSTTSAATTTSDATTSEALEGCDDGPLDAPIPGCTPEFEETGDYYADCVDRINQFRWECQCLPPLERVQDGEACADEHSQHDFEVDEAHSDSSRRFASRVGTRKTNARAIAKILGSSISVCSKCGTKAPGRTSKNTGTTST